VSATAESISQRFKAIVSAKNAEISSLQQHSSVLSELATTLADHIAAPKEVVRDAFGKIAYLTTVDEAQKVSDLQKVVQEQDRMLKECYAMLDRFREIHNAASQSTTG
jgi:hypothetical protein